MLTARPSPAPAQGAWPRWTHNDGWRMRASKAGRKGGTTQTLADLKRLRKEAEAAAHRAAAEASKKETARREASAQIGRASCRERGQRAVGAVPDSARSQYQG